MFLFSFIFNYALRNLFVLLSLITALYVFCFYFKYFTRPNPLPGPFPLPIFGSFYSRRGRLSDRKAWMKWLHKSYGDLFELYIRNNRVIVLCKAEYLDNFFSISTKNKFPLRFPYSEGLTELGNNDIGIIANANVESWKFYRHFFNLMLPPSYSDKTYEIVNKLWKEMESNWFSIYKNSINGFELDLVEWVRGFTTSMIFELNFDCNKFSCMYSEECEKLTSALNIYVFSFEWFILYPYWMRHYVPFMREHTKKLLKNRDELHDIILKIICERRKLIENSLNSKDNEAEKMNDILSKMIMSNTPLSINKLTGYLSSEFDRPMTDNEILGIIIDNLLGGITATASGFFNIVHALAKYPDVLQQFRHELDSVFGEDCERPFTASDLSKLRYGEAIINEVARFNPGAKVGLRVNTEPAEVAGYIWPSGTTFHLNFEMIHYNESHWQNPEVFDPGRFMTISSISKNTLLPFGGGARMCPGRKFAAIALKGLMTMIYRKYDIELVSKDNEIYNRDYFIGMYKNCNVRLKPRNNQVS